MERIPEPEELMDDAEQARAYAEADFSEANTLFVELLEAMAPGPLSGRLVDLGCGPGDIPLSLLGSHPGLTAVAVDGAPSMLALAEQRLAADPSLAARMRTLCCLLPCDTIEHSGYDFILSNSLLHHLADPMTLWRTVKACAKPGAAVLVMDLARPDGPDAALSLVERYAEGAPDVLRRDFLNSLHAAYRVSEIREQLQRAGLSGLDVAEVSDRHLAVRGRMPA